MTATRTWILLFMMGALVIPIVWDQTAQAQSHAEAAARLDEAARGRFAEKDYAGAAELFQKAFETSPHPATMYNVALSWERAGQPARAADAYRQALALPGLDNARARTARRQMAGLERQVGLLTIPGPSGAKVSIAHLHDQPLPIELHLPPGKHSIGATWPDGSTTELEVEVRAGQTTAVVIERPAPPRQPPVSSPPTAVRRRTPSLRAGSGSTWGWVSLGVGTACAGTATYLGIRTMTSLDEFKQDRTNGDARNRVLTLRTWTNVAWAASAVAGGIGLYLLLSPTPSNRTEQALTLGIHPASVDAKWIF